VLTTSVEPLEGNHIKLTVTVPAEEVDAAIKQSYETLGKKVRIPGFRKGHAPRPVVDNYMGKDYVLSEATEALVDSTYPKAIDAENLRPIAAPDVEEVSVVVPGEDYTYVADVEIRPELTLSHTDGIAVTVPPKNVTDAQIDEQVEIARERFATLEPVEDRPLAIDDFALLTFIGDVDGEAYEGNEVDKYLYELGKGQMPVEFDEGIVGMSPGDEKRVEFTIPDTSSKEEYVGKTAGFDVTVHEIKSKVLPEVDDEFALSVGGYDDVAQMREDMRIRLQASQELQHERAKEEALKAQLAERLEGEVPESMIQSKTGQLLRDFQNMLEQRGMTVEAYVAAIGVPIEVLEADINRQGEQAVKEELALEALFRSEGMEVTDEDVRNEIKTMITGSETVDEMLARWTDNGLLPIVREQIIQQRAVKWLLENGTITETDGTEAANAAATPETTEE
jgi:trigger factor